jgi:integrase
VEKNELPHMTFHDFRHVNASVMALLRIPDKYAQKRGGWKTDKTMKKVYQQIFSPKRQALDEQIDSYFKSKMQYGMQHGNKKAP